MFSTMFCFILGIYEDIYIYKFQPVISNFIMTYPFMYSQTPEEWIDDERCIICKYSKRSFPQLCHCHENLIAGNNFSDKRKIGVASKGEHVRLPIPPVRTNSLTRGKKKKVLSAVRLICV